jgi:hypothetical protein
MRKLFERCGTSLRQIVYHNWDKANYFRLGKKKSTAD